MRMNNFLRSLKAPRGPFLITVWIITVLSAASSIILMLGAYSEGILKTLTYASYVIAALSLGYTVYTLVIYLPGAKGKIIAALRRHRLMDELLCSFDKRTVLSAAVALTVGVGYGIFNGVIGILSLSVWYGALAGYYIILAVIRCGILLRHKKSKKFSDTTELKKAKAYRNCGILLLPLNVALSSAIAQMIFDEKGFVYYGILIYVSALYAFIKIGTAIFNFIKAHKQKDPITESVRNLNLIDASVSILALQTAMLFTFSEGSMNISMANTMTGSAVSIFAFSIAIYMIIKGNKQIKLIKRSNING